MVRRDARSWREMLRDVTTRLSLPLEQVRVLLFPNLPPDEGRARVKEAVIGAANLDTWRRVEEIAATQPDLLTDLHAVLREHQAERRQRKPIGRPLRLPSMEWKLIELEDGQARELDLPAYGYPPTVDTIILDWRVVATENADDRGFIYLVRDRHEPQ